MKRHYWTLPLAALISSIFLVSAPAFADSITICVPGTSDIWLAGMPTGSGASGFAPGTPLVDFAPFQSPILLPLSLVPGNMLVFSNVTGEVQNGPLQSGQGPDGNADPILGLHHHFQGAQNGISDIIAPHNSLIAVFLGPDLPELNVPPQDLDFGAPDERNFLTLYPTLRQVFFIGNGLTGDGEIQQFVIPSGATSVYLGTLDGWEWSNNSGSFSLTVEQVDPVPEPSSFLLLSIGLVCLALVYRRGSAHAPAQSQERDDRRSGN